MKYVALLRGINVGGKNKIEMARLRAMFSALGYADVKTYINSGNVVFETRESGGAAIAERIEKAVETEFSLKIKVMTRAFDEIERIISNNPFAGLFENDKDLHVFFLDEKLPDEKRRLLLEHNNENEMYAVENREIFCLLRAGVTNTLMGKDFISKTLKTPATARNWRTVNKIAGL